MDEGSFAHSTNTPIEGEITHSLLPHPGHPGYSVSGNKPKTVMQIKPFPDTPVAVKTTDSPAARKIKEDTYEDFSCKN